ncbi:cupin domain-containing protein [Spirosoma rhododendri]|uniref:Cupin domain-containing protein n=1 Tax=Spirosoma rhododendri TaxID=2728024 RepID=A0A7L5DXB0_9BACT|nr:cupin domain-containing protein [Spirosoma rhododendri]QJD80170.1 cupin domain-containing protein [Spirosoma rhododendri]
MTTSSLFIDDASLPWETVAEGVKRKVMSYEPDMMVVKVAFETGGVGIVHQHVHVQMSYVERGVFAITIGDETRELRQGDMFYIPSDVWHGAHCLEAGVLIDSFTPMRADFL